jgi:nucleotide-binding universal stress UspA family protein
MSAPDGPVVIAYDGSAAARRAVAEAADLLRPRSALVVTVWEPGLAYVTAAIPLDGMMIPPPVDPGVAREVDHELQQHAERVSGDGVELARSLGVDAEPLAVPDDGDIASTILHVAGDRHAVAIVVGSRGLSGLRARLEGSTSKGLLKHAACPVLVVHEADDEDDD